MLRRHALAFYTALFLLLSTLAPVGGPLLVCRISGAVMEPVLVTPSAPSQSRSCCTVNRVATGDGAVYTLSAPGCCELRDRAAHATPKATLVSLLEMPVAVLAPAPTTVSTPRFTGAIRTTLVQHTRSPRAPPRSSASPRAPPLFS